MNTHVNLEKEFVPYTESLEMKHLGFDEPCFGYYNTMGFNRYFDNIKNSDNLIESENIKGNWCTAPTYSQTFCWFREFRDYEDWCIESWIQPYLSNEPRQHEAFYWRRGEKVSVGVFSTYDEAQLNLLRKLIEIVKNK